MKTNTAKFTLTVTKEDNFVFQHNGDEPFEISWDYFKDEWFNIHGNSHADIEKINGVTKIFEICMLTLEKLESGEIKEEIKTPQKFRGRNIDKLNNAELRIAYKRAVENSHASEKKATIESKITEAFIKGTKPTYTNYIKLHDKYANTT